jgi:hypothetical protein
MKGQTIFLYKGFAWVHLCIGLSLIGSSVFATSHEFERGFMPNMGQLKDQFNNPNAQVDFLWNSNGLSVQVTKEGFEYLVYEAREDSMHYHRVEFKFEALSKPMNWIPSELKLGKINVTDPLNPMYTWQLSHYGRLTALDVYPHVDLELVVQNGTFKYNFLVHPGAQLQDIAFQILGAPASLESDGIHIHTCNGDMVESIPLSYWRSNGDEVQIEFSQKKESLFGFAFQDAGITGPISSHLVIDPVPNRLWGSYWGGSALEFVYGLTEDNAGNVFLCGVGTGSLTFTTAGAYQVVMAGVSNDAFLLKFNNAGIIQWCTYYGGGGAETARAVVASNTGEVYICGSTDSGSGIATAGAFRSTIGGNTDGFLTKFSGAGALVWGTYIGGTAEDYMRAVTFDATTNMIAVGGHTKSAGQATAGAHQTTHAGAGDAYLAQFNPAGAQQWATYMGGTGEDIALAVHMRSDGFILVGGSTLSAGGIASAGAHQTTNGGGTDAFIAKFTGSGVRSWSTYMGGTATDVIKGVRFAYDGNAIGVGETASSTGIATALAHQLTYGGGSSDAFVVQMDPAGARLWSTYYGGTNTEAAGGLAIDTTNNIYLAGQSNTLTGLATVDGYQTASAGGLDGLIVQFTKAGLRNWASYYGGPGSEVVNGVVINLALELHIGGHTTSTSGITTAGTSQTVHAPGINDDPFVVKFGNLILPIQLGEVTTQCQNGVWNINWQTMTESNADYFEVYVGSDLAQWQLCQRLEAKGNSLQVQEYSMQGECNATDPGYFQIVLTNTNGSREVVYTGVMYCASSSEWIVAPNPADEVIRILGSVDQCVIYDAMGREMGLWNRTSLQQAIEWNVSPWPNGVYFVYASSNGTSRTVRIVVQHD